MKKILSFVIFLALISFTVSCAYFDIPFAINLTTTQETTTTTLPTKVNGTITFENEDYESLAVFHSSTYDLNDIDDYNQNLYETKEYIRHANIVVNLVVYTQSYPWGLETNRELVSSGSGFIFLEKDQYYYAITNYHVIESNLTNTKVEIKTFSDSAYNTAEIVAYDATLDLAVIKFAKFDRTDVTIIDIYERLYYKFNTGELVMAVGNPSSLNNNVTFGEFKSMESLKDVDYNVLYHDATISNGSSGGALVDVDGNLLGVNTWGLEDSDEFSFAIPNYIVYSFLINKGILD
ncbi:MAG: trypsin-like peptidase domain-containing protein [Candidatus Izemoplasmatales bacterium]